MYVKEEHFKAFFGDRMTKRLAPVVPAQVECFLPTEQLLVSTVLRDRLPIPCLQIAKNVRQDITRFKGLQDAQCVLQAPSVMLLQVSVPHVLKAIIHILAPIHASHVKNED